jgi:hypothetical protein
VYYIVATDTGSLAVMSLLQRAFIYRFSLFYILFATDTGSLDPSLVNRQRELKRARLLDGLNDKLSHRPGPLELVQGNILVSSDELTEAIKGECAVSLVKNNRKNIIGDWYGWRERESVREEGVTWVTQQPVNHKI